ncbi:MAG TPA: 4-alpha-glucanotransferase [Rhodanobacteraceae bacterium]|nr:4-alpha-glucanotransferase [Rhodanobacteraceae bacterium]
MTDKALLALADALGLEARWIDADGRERVVAADALRALASTLGYAAGSPAEIAESRARLSEAQRVGALVPLVVATRGRPTPLKPARVGGMRFRIDLENGTHVEGRFDRDAPALPALAAAGYHALRVGDEAATIAVAPARCFSVDDIGEPARGVRRWGLAAQIYALRRDRDDGIGDLGALAELAEAAAGAGADALAMSPVHATFAAAPERSSPYSPSSRLFLNGLLVDAGARFPDETATENVASDDYEAPIDWPVAGARKIARLAALYRSRLDGDARAVAAFEAFRARGGESLARHVEFEASHAAFVRERGTDWQAWLASPRKPDDDELRFHAFLQWLAAENLADAQRRAREAGMAIGLIADLAVGSDPAGSDAWTRRDEMLGGATIGAPPDAFNAAGQGWGLTTVSPLAMRAHGYRTFLDLLRASMRHGGGIRIDHVMSLMRLWIVPPGAAPLDGAYLRCPLDDLLRLVALESWRHRCLVIGEDLGVVPDGFRERLRRAGVLGTDVLFFMRRERWLPPRRWRRHAVAMTTTHDLPTLAGWWHGEDIEVRARIGLLAPEAATDAEEHRVVERAALAHAINAAGTPKRLLADSDAATFVDGAIGFVGASRDALALVPVEDVLGLALQHNVPGTVDEHPNWRQRLPGPASTLLASGEAKHRLHLLAQARRRP